MSDLDTKALLAELTAIRGTLGEVSAELSEMRRQRDEWRELRDDLLPLGKEIFGDILVKMDEMDRKGYFAAGRELAVILDKVVSHFSVQDIRDLAAAIVPILETFKSVSQPKILAALQRSGTLFESMEASGFEEYTVWRAFRERNTPEMRRGLGLLMAFVKKFGGELGKEMTHDGT